jgi:hypothetical protein
MSLRLQASTDYLLSAAVACWLLRVDPVKSRQCWGAGLQPILRQSVDQVCCMQLLQPDWLSA